MMINESEVKEMAGVKSVSNEMVATAEGLNHITVSIEGRTATLTLSAARRLAAQITRLSKRVEARNQ